eukprot:COSAG01_NODE_21941_length_878_cov_1.618742_1_plen_137_part_00
MGWRPCRSPPRAVSRTSGTSSGSPAAGSTTRDYAELLRSVARLKRAMTKQQHHELYGHLGHFPNCRICRDMARTNRRVSAETEPTMETRPGYLFCMDIITWNFPTRNGEVFFNVLRRISNNCTPDVYGCSLTYTLP